LILYRAEAGVARITLNRPEKRNALNAGLIATLHESLARSARDADVKVVVISGAGSDFCSGADLSGLDHTSDAGVMSHLETARAMADVFLAMRHHPRPVVATVRGRALAGGCGLATACDLILASESAQFGYPEVKIGFVPAMVMAILRRSMTEKRAFELVATGEIITAPQAHAAGLINRVYPDSEFEVRSEEYIASLASKSASAVALAKNLLYHMDGMRFDAALEAGVHGNALARMTEDARRGIERFVKKSESTPPV
jgi:methylglutaconyl-CoA hydratase